MTAGLIWSFVLSGIGIVGIILAGSKYKLGWLIGFFVQPLWIVFAVTTGQYGFILNAVIYATVYARNWLRWRREDREAAVWTRPSRLPCPACSPSATRRATWSLHPWRRAGRGIVNRPNYRDSTAQPVEGSCWMCGALPGQQHDKDCSGYPRTVRIRTDVAP